METDYRLDLSSFLYSWPYYSLVAGIIFSLVLLVPHIALFLGWRPSPSALARWRYWWLLPVYMIHQFEEHGIDIFGRKYSFRGFMCRMLGYPDPLACPVPPSVLVAVNLGTVYIFGLLSGILGPSRPLVSICAIGLTSVNAVNHIVHSLASPDGQMYNPGLVTAYLLFVPFSFWGYRSLKASWAAVGLSVLVGALGHAILFASFKAVNAGAMSLNACIATQIVNGFLPLLGLLFPSEHNSGVNHSKKIS